MLISEYVRVGGGEPHLSDLSTSGQEIENLTLALLELDIHPSGRHVGCTVLRGKVLPSLHNYKQRKRLKTLDIYNLYKRSCQFHIPATDMEKAMAPHSSTLAWKIPWTEEPGGLQSMGSRRVRNDFTFTFTFHFHVLEKEIATRSSVLGWRILRTVEPLGLLSMGLHRVGHD